MERWLRDRGEEVPDSDAHGHGAAAGDRGADARDAHRGGVRRARGGERQPSSTDSSCEYMIRHHEGALQMVAKLFDSSDGGQVPDVFQLAQHIDSDQRIEISRMTGMLAQLATAGFVIGRSG